MNKEKEVVIETSIETTPGTARKFVVIEEEKCLRVFAEDMIETEIVSKYSLPADSIIGMGMVKTFSSGIAISGIGHCLYKRIDTETLNLIKARLEELYPEKTVMVVNLP